MPATATQDQAPAVASSGGAKRTSTTRRGPENTAERRATHNAVERQRRETLNGRFLVCTFLSLFLLQFLTIHFGGATRILPLCCPISLKFAVPPSRRSSILPSLTFTLLADIVSLLPANS